MKQITQLLFAFVFLITFSNCKTDDTKPVIDNEELKPYVDLNYSNYDSLKNDQIFVKSYSFEGTILSIVVQYSGCSADHSIDLVWQHPWCGTPPIPPPTFELRHDSKGEMCEMFVEQTRTFDLSKLKTEYPSGVNALFCYKEIQKEFSCDTIRVR